MFDEKYDRGLKDFGPLLTRMMAKGAELLELDGNAPGEAGLMTKQARQLGFKGVIIQTGGPGWRRSSVWPAPSPRGSCPMTCSIRPPPGSSAT